MSIWNQIPKRYIMCNIRMRERELIFIYSLTLTGRNLQHNQAHTRRTRITAHVILKYTEL